MTNLSILRIKYTLLTRQAILQGVVRMEENARKVGKYEAKPATKASLLDAIA